MGANFMPSVAKLYMAKWEEEDILYSMDLRVVLYRRFFDDLLLIWKEITENLDILLQSMDNNDQNISLTWEISKDNVHFLDLGIFNTP